jgi:hypothetical protein
MRSARRLKSGNFAKIDSAVQEVAKQRRISPTTVWKCWSQFDTASYQIQHEKAEFDFLCDMAYETGRETAIGSLRKEHGPDKEFTDEEIDAEAERLAEEWGRLADYI